MKRRLLAMILTLAMLCSMGVQGSEAKAAETTGTEVTITQVQVVDTDIEIPYKSAFTKDNIAIEVTYSDGTVETTHPDQDITLDTTVLGDQTFDVSYHGVTIQYTIRVVPRQVSGLKIKEVTDTDVTITWTALTEATAYEIYVASKADGSYMILQSTTDTTYTFTDLTKGEIRYVKVHAVADEYTGADSDSLAIALKPGQVTGITATKNQKKKITLTWTQVTGATGYMVYYRRSDSTDKTLAGTTDTNTYQVTGLSAGKDYYFTVVAYIGTTDITGDPSGEVLYGTAPSIPQITKLKGGAKRVKVKWSKGSGADTYNIYVSTSSSSGFKKMATASADEAKIRGVDGLKKNKTYYVKVKAVRTVSGIKMTTASAVKSTKTASKAAKATSTKAKYYTTKKKFKKSAAYKNYSMFKKRVLFEKSFAIPGLRVTNVAGFNSTRMVPQSVTFAGSYLLISAYDYSKQQESVIYVMDKKTKTYLTTIVLPHTGHVGGMTYDGTNIWITYGKKLQSFKFSYVTEAVSSGQDYYELYKIGSTCAMPETVSYVTYYDGMIWAGAYSETSKKYMYGYTIQDKSGTPTLTSTNRIQMPNRTQGVAFTKAGKMIISRSCQTGKGKRGYMSKLVTYKPTMNLSNYTIKKNKKKKSVKMPPMSEGIAIKGSYTYVVYESSSFSECKAPMDHVTAFKTSKITS